MKDYECGYNPYKKTTSPCCNSKHDHNSCPNNQIVEFRYDETPTTPVGIVISEDPDDPTQALAVRFDEINPGDRVWLSGVICVNNSDTDLARTLRLVIQKISPITGTPEPIYTLFAEIDAETITSDDFTVVPFSHVDVSNTQLFDVQYRVVLAVTAGDPNVFLESPNTLTAVRFGK